MVTGDYLSTRYRVPEIFIQVAKGSECDCTLAQTSTMDRQGCNLRSVMVGHRYELCHILSNMNEILF
jgi:hypothetical protein